MYDVDDLDSVVQLHDVPWPDAGAPLPLVLADENHRLLGYLVSDPGLVRNARRPTAVSPESEGLAVAIIHFQGPSAHMFGPPSDETFSGHPLASRGLERYAVSEVQQSSWIRRLQRMNSVHPYHDKARFLAGLRHFVFTFHDSTFECIAKGYASTIVRGSMRSAATLMLQSLAE